ncbi:MAG: hypothetical protein HY222_07500 [Thaumarchaeota archaeon]|nr:hypothetical protein [Nitrososphaerota archaeon]MBI3642220.1 hypothetical protein [Nitrososphaerota archaeon]
MSLKEYAEYFSNILKSLATIKQANVKKIQTASIKKLDKKVDKLEKSLKKHLIINIVVATVFFVLGLLTPTIISYFSHLK